MERSVGVLAIVTHWLRAVKAYGNPPRAAFVVELWWPTSDPKPDNYVGWW